METEPRAGFQAGQVQDGFPPHRAPQRPPWPSFVARSQKSHLASLWRACLLRLRRMFSHSLNQVWREARSPHPGRSQEAARLEAQGQGGAGLQVPLGHQAGGGGSEGANSCELVPVARISAHVSEDARCHRGREPEQAHPSAQQEHTSVRGTVHAGRCAGEGVRARVCAGVFRLSPKDTNVHKVKIRASFC